MPTASELARITNAIRSEQSVRSRATASEFRGDTVNKDPKAVPYVRTGFSYNSNPYTRLNSNGDNMSKVLGTNQPASTPSKAQEITWPSEGLSDAQKALIDQIRGDFESKSFSDDTLARINSLPTAVLNAVPIQARSNAAIAQNQNFAAAGGDIGRSLFRGYKQVDMGNGNPLLFGGMTQMDVSSLGLDGGINSGVESLDIANPLAQSISFSLGVNQGRQNIGDFFGAEAAKRAIAEGNKYYSYDVTQQQLRKAVEKNPKLGQEEFLSASPEAARNRANDINGQVADINKALSTRTEKRDANGNITDDGGFAAGQSAIDALNRKRIQVNGRYTGDYGYGQLNGLKDIVNFTPTTSNLKIRETVNS